jgi:hypothetical protein
MPIFKASSAATIFAPRKMNSQLYQPSKRTVVALCLSLELSEEETGDMLSAAGFSLSDSERFDLVSQFCLEKKIYDIDDVNQALDSLKLKSL